jgi:hypothetical protein
MSEIDLGVSAKDKYEISSPTEMGKEKVYPCFHYCGPVELDLPDEGEMTIRFRKKREASSVEEDGSHWYECDIEVRKMLGVDGEEPEADEAPAKSYDEAGDALDSIRDRLAKHFGKDEIEEERTGDALEEINEKLAGLLENEKNESSD